MGLKEVRDVPDSNLEIGSGSKSMLVLVKVSKRRFISQHQIGKSRPSWSTGRAREHK